MDTQTLSEKQIQGINETIIDDGELGDFFRGEIGNYGCDNDADWIAISKSLINSIQTGIDSVEARGD